MWLIRSQPHRLSIRQSANLYLDILVNNAGRAHSGGLMSSTEDDWEDMTAVKLCGYAEKLQGRHTCHAGAEMGTHRQHVAPSAESIQIRSCPSFMGSAMPINNSPKSIALEAALAVFLASARNGFHHRRHHRSLRWRGSLHVTRRWLRGFRIGGVNNLFSGGTSTL